MAQKTAILASLDESALLLPSLVNRALAANDRVKYRLALLQAAQAYAERPDAVSPSLRAERLAAGVQDSELDRVVGGSVELAPGRYHIPESSRIVRDAIGDVADMLAPLRAAAIADSAEFSRRSGSFASACSSGDELTADAIRTLTSGDRRAGDSLHLLVMDMHRALNELQKTFAGESIDGCSAYGIRAADRARIAAFMSGVNRTAPLKFEHPGLSTTATRVGGTLVLQNDIGTTDAHVLVVHVTGRTVTVTYTDVHLPRLLFFQGMFAGYSVQWQDTRSRSSAVLEQGVYHLSLGTFAAPTARRLREFLSHLGSRLVFLIDWNRARKRLRRFVPKRTAIDVLKWAAEKDIGHMAWLNAGGEQLIFDAMNFARGGQLKPGERLDDQLTEARAAQFLRFTLRQALDGAREGRPASFVADEVRTELASQVRSAEDELLDAALENAGLIVELADAVRGALDALEAGRPEHVAVFAERAKTWESAADRLLNDVRGASLDGDDFIVRLMTGADDIADDLEEAVFHLSVSPYTSGDAMSALGRLCDPVCVASRELVKAFAASRHARRGMPREDVEDFLQAVTAVRTMEHASDLAEREATRALFRDSLTIAELLGAVEAARNLEAAADGLLHVTLLLHDHVMSEVGRA